MQYSKMTYLFYIDQILRSHQTNLRINRIISPFFPIISGSVTVLIGPPYRFFPLRDRFLGRRAKDTPVVYDNAVPRGLALAFRPSANFAEDCTRVPSPEALDAVYRRPCSCASIRHHARSSFANSGKFTKFKCKIGRCSAGSMEARARR